MKILTVVGARPQFIKAAPVSRAILASPHDEYLVHTGQHYDFQMSDIFFKELNLSPPAVNLNIGSGSHGQQTGKMLIELEAVMQQQQPDIVLVYGDTNSTIAGALAAVKLGLPLAHVEAGLRSFNRTMPEEHNRVLTDHASDILLCPTQTAVTNLHNESISNHVHFVGDTMKDAFHIFSKVAHRKSDILAQLDLQPNQYILATVHRPYNTDDSLNLTSILSAFNNASLPVIFPVHPRTRARIQTVDVILDIDHVRLIDPVGYLDMLTLLENTHLLMTDSGGMQKEAYFARVRCITLRPETEWVETLEGGWNMLTGADYEKIQAALAVEFDTNQPQTDSFGNGNAAERILEILEDYTNHEIGNHVKYPQKV